MYQRRPATTLTDTLASQVHWQNIWNASLWNTGSIMTLFQFCNIFWLSGLPTNLFLTAKGYLFKAPSSDELITRHLGQLEETNLDLSLPACIQRERNVLFNDALNTFYLRLYGVRHMVKDHSDSEKGNPLPPHRLLFPISSKGSFICTIPQTG